MAEIDYVDMDGVDKIEFPEVDYAFSTRKLIKATGNRLADVTWPSGRGKASAKEGTKI